MNVVDALYRQSGLHNRLDQLLFDFVYVRELDFTIKSWNNSISPMNDLVINRVCEQFYLILMIKSSNLHLNQIQLNVFSLLLIIPNCHLYH